MNGIVATLLPEIVTWYGHLRDTFAGKILTTFQKYFSAHQKSENILPAKVSRSS